MSFKINSYLTSPFISLTTAYCYVILVGIILYSMGYYTDNSFFNWGPPILFFNKQITTNKEFYGIHCLIFFHQLFNNYVNSVTYPWIINIIQDPKNKKLNYSTSSSIILINFFDLYSELDTMLIIIGLVSQISFLFTLSVANIITSTIINLKYIKQKKENYLLDEILIK